MNFVQSIYILKKANARIMKLRKLASGLALICLVTVAALAQIPVLTVDNLPGPGIQAVYDIDYLDTPYAGQLPSQGGVNVVWDFRGWLNPEDQTVIKYLHPSQTLYSGMDQCVDTSTYAIEVLTGFYLYVYQFRDSTSNMEITTCMGVLDPQTGRKVVLRAIDRDTIAYVPFTYGDTLIDDGIYWGWIDTVYGGLQDTIDIMVIINHTDSVNGWGVLFMPDGTQFNVISVQRFLTLRVLVTERLFGQTLTDFSDSSLEFHLLTDDTNYKYAIASYSMSMLRDSILTVEWLQKFTPSPSSAGTNSRAYDENIGMYWQCNAVSCTAIIFGLPEGEQATIKISDISGRIVYSTTVYSKGDRSAVIRLTRNVIVDNLLLLSVYVRGKLLGSFKVSAGGVGI